MTAVALSPGVWRVPTGHGDRENAFLVEGGDGLTLVDVGWAGAARHITAAVGDLGRSLADVRRIVITHAHPDHVRGLAEFRSTAPHAEVLVHADDSAWLQAGRVPRGGRSNRIAGRVLDSVPLLHWTPVEPDGHLAHGDVVDGLRVIHTPGHSPGHVVVVHEGSRTLLAGDVVLNRGAAPGDGPNALAWDPALRDESRSRLPVDVHAVGVAHGSPLTTSADIDAYLAWLTDSKERP